MPIHAGLLPQTVTIEALAETTPVGQTYASPSVVPALVDGEQRLIRDATGNEIVSSGTVYVDLGHEVPAGSKITIWSGTSLQRTAKVVAVGKLVSRRLANVSLHLE